MSDEAETMNRHGEFSFNANQRDYSIKIIEPTIAAIATRSRALIYVRAQADSCVLPCASVAGKVRNGWQMMQGQNGCYLEGRA